MEDDISLTDKASNALLQAAPGNVKVMLLLAEQSRHRGDLNRAIQLAFAARGLAADDGETAATAADIINRSVPSWHLALVRDQQRNTAFEAALCRNVKPGMRVLDVGAGTGLLAMMAARAGADQVYSCELNPAMAAIAKDIVQANGLDSQIKILPKSSRKIEPAAEMEGLADLVVSEIFGSDLVCEEVLPVMRDVVQRLAKPGARIIPMSGDICVALANWDDLEAQSVADVSGFDLRHFNQLKKTHYKLQGANSKLKLRGPAQDLFSFDFSDTSEPNPRAAIDLVADGGPINGVAQWIRLQMDEEAELENRPGPDATSSWACLFYPLPEPLAAGPGTTIRIEASHNGNRLRLWFPA